MIHSNLGLLQHEHYDTVVCLDPHNSQGQATQLLHVDVDRPKRTTCSARNKGGGDYQPLKDGLESHPMAQKSYGALGPPSIAHRLAGTDVDPSIFTDHGKGLIDFILAYQPVTMSASQNAYREVFEEKLRAHGLYLEYADLDESQDGKTCFIKVHAPWDVLSRMAEVNRLRVPIQQSDIDNADQRPDAPSLLGKIVTTLFCGKRPLVLEAPYKQPYEPPLFNVEFQRNRFKQYMVQDPNIFFTSTQRIALVWDLIESRTMVNSSEVTNRGLELLEGHQQNESVGVNYLLSKGVYNSVYPLHDHDVHISTFDKSRKPTSTWPLRPWLYETWGRFGRWTTYQPLDQIRRYFGEKVALYFAWLGFYTQFLFPLSIVGLMVVIYGLSTYNSNTVVNDICVNMSQTIICRKCGEVVCPFTRLKDSCKFAKATAVFNNYVTVFYALFTALWGITFLEFWKREQATISNRWDCFDIAPEVEPPRSEYITAAKTKRRHPVTLEWEPYIPPRNRLQSIVTSVLTVTFLVCLAIAVIIGVIIYKMVGLVFYYNMRSPTINSMGSDSFTMMSASAINAIAIMILENVYSGLAWKLTEREYPRTETDFETSYTYKMYIFQFVNYYATLFYLAFFQPWLAGNPKTDTIMTDRCPPAGCTFTVTTQLATVLIVKQVINNVMEVGKPALMNWWKRRKNVDASEENQYVRHEKDFDLSQLPPLGLFPEYFEMIMQFGFVTMFVAAFPLAPLFALINNVFEIRIDAFKWVVEMRRCVPSRAKDIGTWYDILEMVARMSVLTNAILISITTDIIDRFVYQYFYSTTGTLEGYVDWALGTFDPRDWPAAKHNPAIYTDAAIGEIHACRYRGYYTGPVTNETGVDYTPYKLSEQWWHVWLAKFLFILIFEHVVFFTQSVIQATVDDIPEKVNLHVQRNRYLEKFMLFKQEQKRQEELRARKAAQSTTPGSSGTATGAAASGTEAVTARPQPAPKPDLQQPPAAEPPAAKKRFKIPFGKKDKGAQEQNGDV